MISFVEAPGRHPACRRRAPPRCGRRHPGCAEIGHLAERAADAVAELVVGRHLAARRRDQRDVVGERPVVANVERSPAVADRIAIDRHRELRLARAGGADHAQAKRLELDLARPLREAAGEPRIERPRLADHGMHLGDELQDVAEKAVDLLLRRQHVAGLGQDRLG